MELKRLFLELYSSTDDVLDKYYGKTSPYINPYNDFDIEYDDIIYEDEYDYFKESTDDDIRKGVL